MEVNFDYDFKLSPASFSDFIRRFGDDPVGVCVTVMKLEVHFLDVAGHVFVEVRLDIHRPLMSVPIFLPLLTEVSGDVPINNRLHYRHTLESRGKIGKC